MNTLRLFLHCPNFIPSEAEVNRKLWNLSLTVLLKIWRSGLVEAAFFILSKKFENIPRLLQACIFYNLGKYYIVVHLIKLQGYALMLLPDYVHSMATLIHFVCDEQVWSIGNEQIHCVQVHDMKDQVHNLVVSNSISCFIPQGAGVKVLIISLFLFVLGIHFMLHSEEVTLFSLFSASERGTLMFNWD